MINALKEDAPKQSWRQISWLVLPPALLVCSTLFLFGPATIYRGNNTEFFLDFGVIIRWLFIPGITVLCLLVLIGFFFPQRKRSWFVSILFGFGILLWVQGNLLVWNYGSLNGTPINWQAHHLQWWVDCIVWVAGLLLACLFRKKLIKISSLVSLTILLLEGLLLIGLVIYNPRAFQSKIPKSAFPPSTLYDYSSSFNIIHILFDGLQTDVFEEVLKAEQLYKEFDGFTLYKENMATFGHTTYSYPSIFSGQVYNGHERFSAFIQETLREKAFYNRLYSAGYHVNLVPGITVPVKRVTTYYRIPKTYGGTVHDKIILESAQLMDLVIFRHSPQCVKEIVYNHQQWFLQPLISTKYTLGYYYQKAFFEDYINKIRVNTQSPCYHFVHLLPPHSPFTTLPGCRYAGRVLPPNRDNYKVEVQCIVNMFLRFLDRLRRLGIYDSSFIVLDADHGWGFPVAMNTESFKTGTKTVPSGIIGRSLALLAIKPRNSHGPLKISSVPTSLRDIPATIMKAAGLPNDYGPSVWDLKVLKGRVRTYENKYFVKGDVFDPSAWHTRISASNRPPKPKITYQWGSLIRFGFTGNAEPFLVRGWSHPEDGFTWAESNTAILSIPLPDEPETPLSLTIRFHPFLPDGKLAKQTVLLSVNGHLVERWLVSQPGVQEKTILIPRLGAGKILELRFDLPDATAPIQLGLSQDRRPLAIALHSLCLRKKTR